MSTDALVEIEAEAVNVQLISNATVAIVWRDHTLGEQARGGSSCGGVVVECLLILARLLPLKPNYGRGVF